MGPDPPQATARAITIGTRKRTGFTRDTRRRGFDGCSAAIKPAGRPPGSRGRDRTGEGAGTRRPSADCGIRGPVTRRMRRERVVVLGTQVRPVLGAPGAVGRSRSTGELGAPSPAPSASDHGKGTGQATEGASYLALRTVRARWRVCAQSEPVANFPSSEPISEPNP